MPVFNKIKLGVRSKIFTASLVIALMLLLSGALAFFELGRMSRYISDFISNSILSVDLTRNLLNTSERYHSDLFRQIGGDGLLAQPETIPAEEFEAEFSEAYSELAEAYDHVVVLCDIYGGTPFNVISRSILKGMDMVAFTGLSLPVLIELLLSRDTASSADEIRQIIEGAHAQTLAEIKVEMKSDDAEDDDLDL